jgi:hypothetical protein
MADNDQDVNTEVEQQETTATDSSAAETKAPEVAVNPMDAWEDKPKEDTTEAEKESDKPEEPAEKHPEGEAVENEAEEQPQAKKDANTRIRQLVAERNDLRKEVERLNSQTYKPKTAQELVDEGMDETKAEVEAIKQKMALDEYNRDVSDAQWTLHEDSSRVLQDFPMFDPDNKEEFDPELAAQAADLLDANLIRDPNTGQIIGSHVSPYQIYKPIADAHKKSAIAGQIKGQKATEQMLASAEVPASASHTQKKNPLMDLWST